MYNGVREAERWNGGKREVVRGLRRTQRERIGVK